MDGTHSVDFKDPTFASIGKLYAARVWVRGRGGKPNRSDDKNRATPASSVQVSKSRACRSSCAVRAAVESDPGAVGC